MDRNIKTRKILSYILTAIGVLSILSATSCQSVSAPENTTDSISQDDISAAIKQDYPALISSLKNAAESFGFALTDLSGICFLNPVRFITPEYSLDDLQQGKNLHILHFPLMNENGEIFAVFTIIKTEEGVNSTLGIDFAPMLNKAKFDGIEEVILCQNINGLFVSSTDNQYILNMQLDKVPAVDGMQITESKLLGCPWVILNLCEINQAASEGAQQAETALY